MTIPSRLYAGLAAFALVLAGLAAVAPDSARASTTSKAAIAGALLVTAVVVAVVALGNGDDEESPQSP